jgi:hypothetical protein
MGKRSNFKRRDRDLYPTPQHALLPLIPYLSMVRTFAEPCCGDGRLVRWLELQGLRCVYSGDIDTGQDALAHNDYGAPDKIITNPPFSIRDQLLPHFLSIAPTWLLLPMDFASNICDAPLLATCTDMVPFGRVRWIEGTKDTSLATRISAGSISSRATAPGRCIICAGLPRSRSVTAATARMRNAAGLITQPDPTLVSARRPAGNAPIANASVT